MSADGGGGGSGGGVVPGGGGSGSGSGPSGGAGGSASGGTITVDVGGTEITLVPARIRRLTNAEYNAAVQSLLGTSATPADEFPPDARQQGYTLNEAQRVDPVLGRALDAAAILLAAEARSKFGALAPCDNAASGGEACASAFFDSFATQAYRRPLTAEDKASLLVLYHAGADGAAYEDGIELVIRGILQSPGFLYLTEIGDGTKAADGSIEITSDEAAAQLSFVVTGQPPDAALLGVAQSGGLETPEGREAEVRRLFATPGGQAKAIRLVREWLGIDRITATAKDSTVYAAFADVRDDMAQETEDFVGEVLSTTPGTAADFLGSTLAVASAPLQAAYKNAGGAQRVGLLNQGAFLSVYAHASETAPVMRGANILRRVACQTMELPTSLNVQIVPPVPDPTKTTRERYAVHSADIACMGCHSQIDPLGFSFEHYDGMGAFRTQENNIDVDSSTSIALGLDFDGTYADSNALAEKLAESSVVSGCFEHQLIRAAIGEATSSPFEKSFDSLTEADLADPNGAMLETLVAYVKSPLFNLRGAP